MEFRRHTNEFHFYYYKFYVLTINDDFNRVSNVLDEEAAGVQTAVLEGDVYDAEIISPLHFELGRLIRLRQFVPERNPAPGRL
jgi:hypothetical protein